jgi:ATP-dependent helicase/nuclease subunit B
LAAPAVFTIPLGTPFVDALAAGILAQHGLPQTALPRVSVLLPNRRACRALSLAFLRQNGGRPLLLPRLLPIGDLDEDELAFAEAEIAAGDAALDLPPAIAPLTRLLELARLVKETPRPTPSDDVALRLARELARLIDQAHIERLDFAKLTELVPGELAHHWELTLDFLLTLTRRWREVLAARQALDPAERRNRLLEAQAEAWAARPPDSPVIAAGSTGSIPATADLIAVVARLPRGAVVLPGLDMTAPDDVWDAILEEPTHPQHGMARLLARLAVDRRHVRPWPAPHLTAVSPGRAVLLHQALRPARAANLAAAIGEIDDEATAGLARLDAPGPGEEARAIALIMRETLEQPQRTAALVTADRGLARRVATELARWHIEVDDSAGEPLANTPPAVFLRLVVALAESGLAPLALLAVLKHPLAAAGLAPAACRRRTRRLELTLRRKTEGLPGFAGVEAIAAGDERLQSLIAGVTRAMAPLKRLYDRQVAAPLTAWITAHVAAAEALAETAEEPGAERLWAGDAGEALASLVAELGELDAAAFPVHAGDYMQVFDELLVGRVVRPAYGRHPRLQIWGPIEARLQSADRVILGGLNEGSWPPDAPANPWMSRPMMRAFGLPLPERRIGLSAHDFAQAATAPEVFLTRACRAAGSPTVPSRWLVRLDALIAGARRAAVCAAGVRWLAWQKALDQPSATQPQPRPEPRPPLAARPRDLAVTDVELWLRDPYALYAKHILKLKPLEPIDADPDAADFGQFMHQVLDDFARETPPPLPDDALARLLNIGERRFGNLPRPATVRAFWWPRFERIARWFIAEQRRREGELDATATEVKGAIVLETLAAPFRVRARADRIDQLKDGSLVIIDYKTGAPPTRKEVAAGFAPQLPLEAAIAARGGFEGVGQGVVAGLEYWRLKAAGSSVTPLDGGRPALPPPPELARQTEERLRRWIALFDDPATPYVPRPRPRYAPRYSDYEHLARVKEWSVGGGEEGDESG